MRPDSEAPAHPTPRFNLDGHGPRRDEDRARDEPAAERHHPDAPGEHDEPVAHRADEAAEHRADQPAGHAAAVPVEHRDHEPVAHEEPAEHRDDEPTAREELAVHDEPAAHDEPVTRDEPVELKPGDVPTTLVATIWTEDSAQGFRDRWREAQLRFIDDPRQVAHDARDLVNEAVEALTTALATHREQLNAWDGDNSDTEQYRIAVQRYRTFFDRLLAM